MGGGGYCSVRNLEVNWQNIFFFFHHGDPLDNSALQTVFINRFLHVGDERETRDGDYFLFFFLNSICVLVVVCQAFFLASAIERFNLVKILISFVDWRSLL